MDDAAERSEPDTRFRYGGGQRQLAGGVAVVASGKSWPELLEETYIEPCRIDSLVYGNGEGDLIYPEELEGDCDNVPETENPNMEAGAFINVEDYATLLLMHLRGGLCGDERVLSEEAVARMQLDRIGAEYDGSTTSDYFEGYGLGWWVERSTGAVLDSGAFGSTVWLYGDGGYAVALFVEANVTVGGALGDAAAPVVDQIFSE